MKNNPTLKPRFTEFDEKKEGKVNIDDNRIKIIREKLH